MAKIVIFGRWKRWGNLTTEDKGVQSDALWRSTPRRVWEVVISELFDHFTDQVPGAPGEVAVSTRLHITGGKEREDDDEEENCPRSVTVPDLQTCYAKEFPRESGYRAGGKRLAPEIQLPQTTSRNDNWLTANETRRNRGTWEHWRTQSDSELRPVDEQIAGNRP